MRPFPTSQTTATPRPSREQLTALLARNRKSLGLTRTELFTLERLMALTDYGSWSDPAGIPVCWIGSADLARKHAVDRGSWRRVERQLEAKGFIQRRTPGNNYRGAIRSSRGEFLEAFGIYFPLLDRLDDLYAIDAARYKSEDLIERLTAEARAWRGRWLRLIKGLAAHAADLYDRALAVYQCHTRAKRAYASHSTDQLRALKAFAEEQIDIISHEVARRKINASEVETDRANTDREQGLKSVRGSCFGSTEDGDRGTADRYTMLATRFLARMTEDELERLCSPQMQEVLAVRADQRPTVIDFRQAAASRAHALGISNSLWGKACTEMGRDCATIALIVIDRNLAHPTRPIRSAAGVLHAMIRRREEGLLNLSASVYALAKRTRCLRDRHFSRRPGFGPIPHS